MKRWPPDTTVAACQTFGSSSESRWARSSRASARSVRLTAAPTVCVADRGASSMLRESGRSSPLGPRFARQLSPAQRDSSPKRADVARRRHARTLPASVLSSDQRRPPLRSSSHRRPEVYFIALISHDPTLSARRSPAAGSVLARLARTRREAGLRRRPCATRRRPARAL